MYTLPQKVARMCASLLCHIGCFEMLHIAYQIRKHGCEQPEQFANKNVHDRMLIPNTPFISNKIHIISRSMHPEFGSEFN